MGDIVQGIISKLDNDAIMKTVEDKLQLDTNYKQVLQRIITWVQQNLLFRIKTEYPAYVSDNYEEMDGDETDQILKLGFSDEELLFLQQLEQCNLKKDLTIPSPQSVDPLCFELKHREETIEQVLEVASNHFKYYSLQKKTKQELNFFIAKGGSGSGKTCILTEIPKIMRNGKGLDDIFKNQHYLF